MSSRAEKVFRFLTEHRALVLAGHAVLLVVALSGLRSLRVDYSAEQFFLFGGPEREVFDEFKTHFPREDLQVSACDSRVIRKTADDPAGPRTSSRPASWNDSARPCNVPNSSRPNGPVTSSSWIGETDFVEETLEDQQPVVTFVRLARTRPT